MKKIVSIIIAFLVITTGVSAHVVVKPAQVGVGSFQTFTTGVPNEKDNPTVGVRLIIPKGLHHVTPNVKPGWNVEVVKSGDREHATVTEIVWTGGRIPAGQRDEFLFSAQVPAAETTLMWKAYQTYASGDIVEWIHEPSEDAAHGEAKPPYSQTKVVNDLEGAASTMHSDSESKPTSYDAYIAYIALAIAAASLAMSLRKK